MVSGGGGGYGGGGVRSCGVGFQRLSDGDERSARGAAALSAQKVRAGPASLSEVLNTAQQRLRGPTPSLFAEYSTSSYQSMNMRKDQTTIKYI